MDRLVLWDIDRTLVAVGIGREIYTAAFTAATGRPLEVLPDFGGRLDRDLVQETLTVHGVPVTEQRLATFFGAMVSGYHRRAAEVRRRGRALAGAREALGALAAVAGVVQTVVTGNIRPVAVAKLTAFELHEPIDFEVGGYGCQDRVRATLVRRAYQQAQDKYGRRVATERVVVVGDTPYDIAAARAVGVRSIGVATGSASAAALTAAGADLVLADLAKTAALLEFVL